jgi:hypothetical protein
MGPEGVLGPVGDKGLDTPGVRSFSSLPKRRYSRRAVSSGSAMIVVVQVLAPALLGLLVKGDSATNATITVDTVATAWTWGFTGTYVSMPTATGSPVIYLATNGNDSNNGLSFETAVATIAHAEALAEAWGTEAVIGVYPGDYQLPSGGITVNPNLVRWVGKGNIGYGAGFGSPPGIGSPAQPTRSAVRFLVPSGAVGVTVGAGVYEQYQQAVFENIEIHGQSGAYAGMSVLSYAPGMFRSVVFSNFAASYMAGNASTSTLSVRNPPGLLTWSG